MHIIRDTENKLNPVPEEAIMVPSERNICLCTEDVLEGLWAIRIEKIWKKPDPEGDQKGSLLQIMKCNWIIVAYIIIAVAHWSMITAVSITLRVKKAGVTYYCRVRKPCHFFQQKPDY